VALVASFTRRNRALSVASCILGAFVLAIGILLILSSFKCKKPRALPSVVVCTHGAGTYTLNVHAHRTIIVVDAIVLLCQAVGLLLAVVNAGCRSPPHAPPAQSLPSVEAQVVRHWVMVCGTHRRWWGAVFHDNNRECLLATLTVRAALLDEGCVLHDAWCVPCAACCPGASHCQVPQRGEARVGPYGSSSSQGGGPVGGRRTRP
jgi:hypothetical protein